MFVNGYHQFLKHSSLFLLPINFHLTLIWSEIFTKAFKRLSKNTWKIIAVIFLNTNLVLKVDENFQVEK